jgi:pyruvate dehydrogenase E2 component (dihydrolipoamide acetyltransferase)
MGKIITVTLPDIGEGVVEGEVVQWLKNVNDPLKQDEPVVLVMTDKATVELPSPFPGKLIKQHRLQGEIAQKDKPLYDIETLVEDATAKPIVANKTETSPSKKPIETIPPSDTLKSSASTSQKKALAIPAIRHLAKEMGIDIDEVKGTGKDGRVSEEDLRHYCEKQQKKEPSTSLNQDDEEIKLSGIPLLMANKMAESKKNIPHFSYFEQVEITRLMQMRSHFKKEGIKQGIQVTFIPFLIRALSLTIHKYPRLNSSLDLSNKTLHIHKHHHIGIAMSTDLGLIVPVLKNVESLSLNAIVYAYEELKQKAFSNHLQSADMKGATITISNFGIAGSGGQWATPIINYPEAAILAISRIEKEPFVNNNEEIAVGDIMHLSWSFDHRIIDGEYAALASHYFAKLIHHPASIL